MNLEFNINKEYINGDILFYAKDKKGDIKTCLICHFEDKTFNKYKLSCHHSFHSRCFRRYCFTKNEIKCPLCGDIEPFKEFKNIIK